MKAKKSPSLPLPPRISTFEAEPIPAGYYLCSHGAINDGNPFLAFVTIGGNAITCPPMPRLEIPYRSLDNVYGPIAFGIPDDCRSDISLKPWFQLAEKSR